MKTINPFGANILVQPAERTQVLVSERKTYCDYGEVVAVGPDVKNVKVGDVIAFTVWGLNHIEIDDVQYFLVPENDRFILGKVVEPTNVPIT